MRSRYFHAVPVALAAIMLAPAGALAQQTTPKAKAKAPAKATPATSAKGAKPSTTPPATDEAPAAADSVKPGQAEYERIFEQWKTVLKDLRKLKVQYASAPEAEHQQIIDQWTALIAKGNEVLKTLQAAGLKAYEESPNTDPDLGRFLVKLASDHIDHDRYTDARAISEVLIANDCPDKSIYNSGAIAAYVLNDFEKADEYFKLASEAGVVSEYGKELMPSVEEYKKLWEDEQKIREAEAAKDDLPRVKLETTQGDIVIELFEDQAPDTVGNFISLVEKKDESGKGYYDGLSFHRVLKNFMAQGGDPKGDGTGGPGYTIYCECYKEDYRRHFQGTLSMAHAGRDTGGSQFFLTFRPTPHLNGKHTAFGRVIEGMDVLAKLQRINPDEPRSAEPDKIVTATVVRKRDHAYAPKKVE
jgi:cyclophilin family peptidyl-prolyl cis-trans isomerase